MFSAVLLTSAAWAQEAPVTLTVQTQTGESNIKLFSILTEEFEKLYPNVTVRLQTISQDQKVGANLAVLASNNPPDVGMIPINSQVYTQLVNNNALLPLSDVWEASDLKRRYGETVANSLIVKDVPYTVVTSQAIYDIVWYNPALFEKAGIPAPENHRIKSMDDLVDIASKLKAAGFGPLQIGGGSGYQASWFVDALLPTSATAVQMQNYLQTQDPEVQVVARYDDAAFLDVLMALNKLNGAGVFQAGFLGQKAPDAFAPFLAGTAGMAIGGDWDLVQFGQSNLNFEPDWALLPPISADRKVVQTLYFGDALGIPAAAKNPDWAKKFLQFVVSDEIQELANVRGVGILPSVNSLPAEAIASLNPITQELLADITANGSAPGWTGTIPGGVGQQFLDPLIQEMYSGGLTPADIAAQQQQRLEEFRATGK